MKIISKFHDYYDNFLTPETKDPKVVFKRTTSVISSEETPQTSLKENLRSRQIFGPIKPSIQVGLLLLCGKIYPVEIQKKIGEDPVFHWKDPYRNFQRTKKEIREDAQAAAQFKLAKKTEAKWGEPHPEALQLNQQFAPILLLTDLTISLPNNSKFGRLFLNPSLKALNFPMSGHEVVQELMGFLATQDPTPVQTDPKYRALAHGMDKTSFRREKGGPTRKRKKHD